METQKPFYSIGNYQGAGKWCFAIALNRALDNLNQRPTLFRDSLLRYERTTPRDWFDEETRRLIQNADIKQRLWHIRCYFSHYLHVDTCLDFSPDDDLRRVMDAAYTKAIFEQRKRLTKDIDIQMPALFEPTGRITAPGVVFFCSFLVERRILNRLMGYVAGFRKTEGEYGFTRRVFSTYCLRDSHSIQAEDTNAVMFRDILGYLSRVPSGYYRHNKDKCDTERHPERKTDKFIGVALRYLETFAFARLRNCTACFGRKQILREERQQAGEEQAEYRAYPPKARVKVVFEQGNGAPAYYINHNTVILRTAENKGTVHNCKIGLNDLKYLVLLCLQDKAEDAITAIDGYVRQIRGCFRNGSATVNGTESQHLIRGLPEFMRVAGGIDTPDRDKSRKARLDHVRTKWEKKKAESPEAELHRKARDIIRYVNWQCERPLGVEQYNRLLELLVKKDLGGFGNELGELKRRERISENVLMSLGRAASLNGLHTKVCDLVLAELECLAKNDPEKLDEYIGLVPREKKEGPSYEQKVQAFVEQPMIYRGFLRDRFFRNEGKTFAKLVEDVFVKAGYPDVPLGPESYHVSSLGRFEKDNSVLYETLARDRLCVMMARRCYERLNDKLRTTARGISWEKRGDREAICLELLREDRPGQVFRVRFAVRDYAKLYVMVDTQFLAGLVRHFFQHEREIDYHRLYSDGINKYTTMQKDGITPILKLEEKIIGEKRIPPSSEGYIEFRAVMDNSALAPEDKKVLTKVRNSLLHYKLEFDPDDWQKFTEIVRREGLHCPKKTRRGAKKCL